MSTVSKPETGAYDQVATAERVAADLSGDASWTRRVEVVVRSVQVRLGFNFDPAQIRNEVEAEFATYDAARVREFVPILVESRVQARLRRTIPTVRVSPLPESTP